MADWRWADPLEIIPFSEHKDMDAYLLVLRLQKLPYLTFGKILALS